jgi:hypothetical protein
MFSFGSRAPRKPEPVIQGSSSAVTSTAGLDPNIRSCLLYNVPKTYLLSYEPGKTYSISALAFFVYRGLGIIRAFHGLCRSLLWSMVSYAAHASRTGGITVVRRKLAWVTVNLIWAAVAAGNSDQSNAIAPVIKGAANARAAPSQGLM